VCKKAARVNDHASNRKRPFSENPTREQNFTSRSRRVRAAAVFSFGFSPFHCFSFESGAEVVIAICHRPTFRCGSKSCASRSSRRNATPGNRSGKMRTTVYAEPVYRLNRRYRIISLGAVRWMSGAVSAPGVVVCSNVRREQLRKSRDISACSIIVEQSLSRQNGTSCWTKDPLITLPKSSHSLAINIL